ncbi:Serine/threonine-protein kinase tousled-like 2 [Frankliniella fusca]|uniref:Serine/threonine-protein kinase tousled-like 2 n=1 Tax=Frankliniella fusca TaxID=407009 RepID=A0AAE1HSP7_9NEOP|nr:Serine/threonine-protein kinase tousled-like 2 [Frankliniella fusca]
MKGIDWVCSRLKLSSPGRRVEADSLRGPAPAAAVLPALQVVLAQLQRAHCGAQQVVVHACPLGAQLVLLGGFEAAAAAAAGRVGGDAALTRFHVVVDATVQGPREEQGVVEREGLLRVEQGAASASATSPPSLQPGQRGRPRPRTRRFSLRLESLRPNSKVCLNGVVRGSTSSSASALGSLLVAVASVVGDAELAVVVVVGDGVLAGAGVVVVTASRAKSLVNTQFNQQTGLAALRAIALAGHTCVTRMCASWRCGGGSRGSLPSSPSCGARRTSPARARAGGSVGAGVVCAGGGGEGDAVRRAAADSAAVSRRALVCGSSRSGGGVLGLTALLAAPRAPPPPVLLPVSRVDTDFFGVEDPSFVMTVFIFSPLVIAKTEHCMCVSIPMDLSTSSPAASRRSRAEAVGSPRAAVSVELPKRTALGAAAHVAQYLLVHKSVESHYNGQLFYHRLSVFSACTSAMWSPTMSENTAAHRASLSVAERLVAKACGVDKEAAFAAPQALLAPEVVEATAKAAGALIFTIREDYVRGKPNAKRGENDWELRS